MYTNSRRTVVVQPGEGNRLIWNAPVKRNSTKLLQRPRSCPHQKAKSAIDTLTHTICRGVHTYAITHASAALALKKKYPRVGLWPLLISVQAVELLWIAFTYLKIEHFRVSEDAIHLDFLPYSHSVLSGALLATLAWLMGRSAQRVYVGAAIGLGIFSHIVLDIIHHEPNIVLLPVEWGPRLGLNLQGFPLVDFLVELAFCVACWKIFGGSKGLLIGIVIFNLFNIPLMFPQRSAIELIGAHPFVLPSVILVQVVATWLLVWWFGRERVFLGSTHH
jgi:hypothetical protein